MTTVLLQPWVTMVHLWLLKQTLSLVRFHPRTLPFKVTLHLCCIVMFRLGGARSALISPGKWLHVAWMCFSTVSIFFLLIWGNQNKSTSLEIISPLPIDTFIWRVSQHLAFFWKKKPWRKFCDLLLPVFFLSCFLITSSHHFCINSIEACVTFGEGFVMFFFHV